MTCSFAFAWTVTEAVWRIPSRLQSNLLVSSCLGGEKKKSAGRFLSRRFDASAKRRLKRIVLLLHLAAIVEDEMLLHQHIQHRFIALRA
jgi:hypothetical protein